MITLPQEGASQDGSIVGELDVAGGASVAREERVALIIGQQPTDLRIVDRLHVRRVARSLLRLHRFRTGHDGSIREALGHWKPSRRLLGRGRAGAHAEDLQPDQPPVRIDIEQDPGLDLARIGDLHGGIVEADVEGVGIWIV